MPRARVRAGVLPRRGRGRPAVAHAGGVCRGRGRSPRSSACDAGAGRTAGARVQAGRGRDGWESPQHDRRSRHRRHAVPRRFAGDGAERLRRRDPADDPSGAARARDASRPAAAASSTAPPTRGTMESWQHIAVPRSATPTAAEALRQSILDARRRPPGRRRLARACASARSTDRARS